jgi:hypothetical protein
MAASVPGSEGDLMMMRELGMAPSSVASPPSEPDLVPNVSPSEPDSPPNASESPKPEQPEPEASEQPESERSTEPPKPEQEAKSDQGTSASAEAAVKPFDFWSKFNPPTLPRGLLPLVIGEFALEKSRLMGADPGGLAMAALTACAAAIPDKVKLKVRRHDSWLESTRLWTGLIGGPGEKKSPTIFQVMKHLKRRDYEMWRKYAREKKEWEGLNKDERQGRDPPRQERLVVEDITMEAMQEVMRDSPNGLLCHRDELSGWFGSMDKYGGRGGAAADRGFWLQAYDGGSYGYNRIGRGSHMIENLSASLLGGIQPEPMRAIADTMVDDGLIQRIVPIVMAPAMKAIDVPISDAELRYEHLIERLFKIEEAFDGYIIFDDAAAEVRDRLEQKHLDLTQFRVFSKKLRSHIAKYDKTFARLCLLWHCIENAPCELGMVSETTAVRVADFLHKFLLPHAMTFYNDVYGLADDHDKLEELVNYILAHGLTVVTCRTVHHGSGRMRGLKAREVEDLFQQLEALGWVKRVQGRRVDMVQWQVNPEVHRLFRARAEQEAERRSHDRQMLQDMFAQGRSV